MRNIRKASRIKRAFDWMVVPQHLFLVFASFFGLLLVFLVPPLEEPDANSHFLRAYQISNFDFVSREFKKDGKTRYGSDIPVSINKALNELMGDVPGQPNNRFDTSLIGKYITQPLEPSNTEKTVIEAAAIYSPVVYIPQAIGISIGKIINASPLVMIWLARLVCLVFWLFIMYAAIKFLPFAKWGLTVLALSPMAVFFSSSLSPDVLNISVAFLFVSLVLSTRDISKPVSTKVLVLILVTLGILALSKPVNLLFAPLLFVIPKERFAEKFRYLAFCIGGMLLAFCLFALWNGQIKHVLDAAVLSQSGGQHIQVSDQLSYILHHPFGYMKDIIKNYIIVTSGTYGDSVLITFFGVFGWLDTTLPLWSIILYILILGLAVLYQFGRGIYLKTAHRIFLVVLFGLAFIGTVTAMYFNATPVGSHIVSGVQGRYFIPFSVLLLGIFTGRHKILQLKETVMMKIVGSALLVVLLMTVLKIWMRYYS